MENHLVDETADLIHGLTDVALGRSVQPAIAPKADREKLAAALEVIDRYSHVDQMPSPAGSLRLLKRVVLRVAAFNWARQRAVNRSVLTALALLVRELDELRAEHAQSARRAAAATASSVTDIRLTIEDLERSVEQLEARLPTDRLAVQETRARGRAPAASDQQP